MRALTELFIGGLDLIKAELREARRSTARTTTGLMLVAMAAFFAALALLVLLTALLLGLARVMPWPAALLIVGLVCALVAALIAWAAQRKLGS